jgi:hypothetical protein
MFGDDPKTPVPEQRTPKTKEDPPVKLKDDDADTPYRFTDWAQI